MTYCHKETTMEETTIQPSDDEISTDSDDSSYDELFTALNLINGRLDDEAYCWKGAEENLIDPAYEKRLAFENFLDGLNRRLAKPVANETFRIVREVELTQFRLLKRGSTGRALRNDALFICLATIVWGILFLSVPDAKGFGLRLLYDFATTGFLPPTPDVLEIVFLGLNWILLLGIACFIVVRIIIRSFEISRCERERPIPPECIVERNFREESGVRVKINLDHMLTIDELVKVHKVNLKILKEKAKLSGLTLEKPDV